MSKVKKKIRRQLNIISHQSKHTLQFLNKKRKYIITLYNISLLILFQWDPRFRSKSCAKRYKWKAQENCREELSLMLYARYTWPFPVAATHSRHNRSHLRERLIILPLIIHSDAAGNCSVTIIAGLTKPKFSFSLSLLSFYIFFYLT